MKSGSWKNAFFIIILSCVSFGVYVNALHGDFLVDDEAVILRDVRIHDLYHFTRNFRIGPGQLEYLSRAINWHISAADPFSYHLTAVIAHLFCVILLFILCNLLFKNRVLSFLSSLIFAIHPIHTEAVSWISGDQYVVASVPFILSLIFYIRSGRSVINLAFSALFAALCLLTGNAVVMLPIMFILYDLFFRNRATDDRRLKAVRWWGIGLILPLSLLCMGTCLFSRSKFMHLIFNFRGAHYLVVIVKAFAYYLKILYLPLARGLYHPFAFNSMDIQQISFTFFLGIFILLVLVIAFFKLRKDFPAVSFGIMWFLVNYAPYSNIIPVCNIVSERYMYLPSAGIAIMLAAGFLWVWDLINQKADHKKLLRGTAICCLTAFLGSYAGLTIKRNYEYSNIIMYWQTNINNFPDGYKVYNNLAATYYAMGIPENAIGFCWINLMVNPRQPHVWCNLGKVYRETGNLEMAKYSYAEALKIDPGYFPALEALKEIKTDKDPIKEIKK